MQQVIAKCPFCAQLLTLREDMVGTVVSCPVCNNTLTITANLFPQTMPKPPSPFQPPSYYDYRNSPEVKTYLIPSILVTLGCCVPLGIAAIYYAAQVKSHLASGNYNAAVKASDNAQFFCWLSFGVGIIIAILAYSLRK